MCSISHTKIHSRSIQFLQYVKHCQIWRSKDKCLFIPLHLIYISWIVLLFMVIVKESVLSFYLIYLWALCAPPGILPFPAKAVWLILVTVYKVKHLLWRLETSRNMIIICGGSRSRIQVSRVISEVLTGRKDVLLILFF